MSRSILRFLPAGLLRWLFCLLFLSNGLTALQAAEELLVFDDDGMRERYYQLIGELRCPKCQNQNLADSNAPIAEDLRNELHTLLNEGYSDADILEFMQARYGDFVLYDPPLNRSTVVLWLLPLMLALAGITVVVRLSLRRSDNSGDAGADGTDSKAAITPADTELDRRVDELLGKFDDD